MSVICYILTHLLIIKHFVTGPNGNSEFCFPSTLNVPRGRVEGKQNSLFPVGPVIKRFVISTNSKMEQIIYRFICLTPAGTQVCHGFKVHDLISCELKVQVVVSLGS